MLRANLIGCIFLLLFAMQVSTAQQEQSKLFFQSAAASLENSYERSDLSWLLLDASGQVVKQDWKDAETPIAVGSLVKPFLALAYAQQHNNSFPHVYCVGAGGHCWLSKGHGDVGFEESIAQSCNAYFLSLAKDVNCTMASDLYARYGLNGPPMESGNEALIGLNGEWKERPQSLARAYLQLVAERSEPVQRRIIKGMELAAQHGTARAVDAAIGLHALAKTGTTICSHHPNANADGFAIVLYPASKPALILLVCMHGATGAKTAAVAGEMLRSIGIGQSRSQP